MHGAVMTEHREQRNAGDAVLIMEAAAGDAAALETLYDQYSRVVFSFALRIVGDPQIAEEICRRCFSGPGNRVPRSSRAAGHW